MTIWIGEIQWMLGHGFAYRRDPILQPLESIATKDALLDLTDPSHPREAGWPTAEFIVGNPPFLGNRFLRRGLGTAYTEALWSVFDERLPHSSDLCCYWHEKSRAQVSAGLSRRAGLLATQLIRGQANRRVLERIRQSGAIFFARADDPWVQSGANVHISFVGQDDGSEPERELDGRLVAAINPDLTDGLDLTLARRLRENSGIAFTIARPELRLAITGLARVAATPRLAKHRLFVWLTASVLPDSQIIVIARDDDFTLESFILGSTSCGLSLRVHSLRRALATRRRPRSRRFHSLAQAMKSESGSPQRRNTSLHSATDGSTRPDCQGRSWQSGPSRISTTRARPGSPTVMPISTRLSWTHTGGQSTWATA